MLKSKILFLWAPFYFIFDLANCVLIRVPYYYDVNVLSQSCSNCFVFFFKQFTKCGLQFLDIFMLRCHFECFMKTSCDCFTALDVLLIGIFVVKTLEIDIKCVDFFFQLFLIKKVIVFMHSTNCDTSACCYSCSRWILWLANCFVKLLHTREIEYPSKHVFIVFSIYY